MSLLGALISILRGTADRDAFVEYRDRVLRWAKEEHQLSLEEYRASFEGRFVDGSGRDLFLDYLMSASRDSPSYLTDDRGLLAERKRLFDRFGLAILTMAELRDEENKRLGRMDSPLRL